MPSNTSNKTYYEILGVSSQASTDEIKKAFKKLAVKHHPDAGGDEAVFKEISEAYEVLSDPKKRKEYDQYQQYGQAAWSGSSAGNWSAGMDWSAILESLRRGEGAFGTNWDFGFEGSPRRQRGADLTMNLELSFEDAFKGAERHVAYTIPSTKERAEMTVKIPAGAQDGAKLRFKKKGEHGKNGGTRGDLLISIKVKKHPIFTQRGADILMDLPLSPAEAALGCEIVVPSPEGKELKLKIPAGSYQGQIFKFKELGAPDPKHKGKKGALMAQLNIEVPKDLSQEERSLYEQLRELDKREIRSASNGWPR